MWKEYTIQFSGLKPGIHTFQFELDQQFLASFDYNDTEEAEIKAEVQLDKKTNMLVVDTKLTGYVVCSCDRCTYPVKIEINSDNKLYVKFSDEEKEGTEEIIYIGQEEYQLNMAPFLYEYVVTSIPQRRVHEDGACNQEMINKLENLTAQENNTDPRWGKLKDLNLEL